MNDKQLRISTPSDRELVMSRVFDAPRELVFDAFTKPALVKRWFGVRDGWSMESCTIELRVGTPWRGIRPHSVSRPHAAFATALAQSLSLTCQSQH